MRSVCARYALCTSYTAIDILAGMNTKKKNLIHIRVAARYYGLPTKWLREQAKAGTVPALIADNQVLFDADILADWLAKRAREGGRDNDLR
jgi:hypothetical protein